MAPQNLAAGSGVLINAANVVATHRQQQQSIVSGVEGSIQALAPGWKGSGGTAFTTAANQWIQDAKNIIAVLDRFESSLRGTHTTYQNTEANAAAGAQKLGGASQGYHGMMP